MSAASEIRPLNPQAADRPLAQLIRELAELDHSLRVTIEEGARETRSRIERGSTERVLRLIAPAGVRIDELLISGSCELARLQGFPPDERDDEARALTQAFAYTFAAGSLSTRPARARLRAISEHLTVLSRAGVLDQDSRRLIALQIWSAASPLAGVERQAVIERLEKIDPETVIALSEIDQRWGVLAPVTATAAQRMLDQGENAL